MPRANRSHFLSESSTAVASGAAERVEDSMALSKTKIEQFREFTQRERDAKRDADDLAHQISSDVLDGIRAELREHGISFAVCRDGARISIELEL